MNEHFLHADDIAHNLRLRKSGNKYHGACPVCGYESGFSLTTGENGKVIGYCHANRCDMKGFFRALYMGEAIPTSKGSYKKIRVHNQPVEYGKEFQIEDLWHVHSRDPEGSVVEKYLNSRGLTGIIPANLRVLNDAYHSESRQCFPVMLGKVERIGMDGVVAVHRTFLKSDGSGKASVEPCKKSLGKMRGGGVFLGNLGRVIAVSEGIENGLTFQQATGIPTIAALSAAGMRELILPVKPLAEQIYIIADNDSVGQEAARDAANRWSIEYRHVTIITPPEPGVDLNDLLVRSLKEGGAV